MKEIKPGKELDALIAEKVMGWIVPHRDSLLDPDDLDGPHYQLPNYSADIALAFKVLEKFESWSMKGNREDDQVVAAVQFEENKFYAKAETAPHAICLAALKAIEITTN